MSIKTNSIVCKVVNTGFFVFKLTKTERNTGLLHNIPHTFVQYRNTFIMIVQLEQLVYFRQNNILVEFNTQQILYNRSAFIAVSKAFD